jgi:hypothetical protein
MVETFRSLGQSLLGVVRAEVEALQADLSETGQRAGVAAGLLAVAAVLGFWAIGLLIVVVIAVLLLWLPLWGAALATLVVFAAAAGILAALGLKRLKLLRSPVTSIQERISSHLDWWQHSFLATPGTPVPSVGATRPEELSPYEEELP